MWCSSWFALLIIGTAWHSVRSQSRVIVGSTGATGINGRPGHVGAPGRSGPAGLIGEAGPPGQAGPPGGGGNIGAPGVVGPPGPRGWPGPIGYAGPAGPQGAPGSPGEQGKQGATGRAGQSGRPGQRGYDGQPGGTGGTGYTGRSGREGQAGATGTSGLDGYDGEQGPKGDVGDPGPVGPPGPSCDPATQACSRSPNAVGPPGRFRQSGTKRWGGWAKHMLNPYLLVVMLVWMFILSICTMVAACMNRRASPTSFVFPPGFTMGSSPPIHAANGNQAVSYHSQYEDVTIKGRPESGYDDNTLKKMNGDTKLIGAQYEIASG